MISQKRLHELFSYDPDTGHFTRRLCRGPSRAGSVAGRVSMGYVKICVDRREYMAHRLAWLYVTGEWPAHEIDHVNRVKSDNRFANLREATHEQNQHNRSASRNDKTGFKGVSVSRTGKFRAFICVSDATIYLGEFSTAEQAHAAYAAAATLYHGEFARVA